jgi:hypothetical protein
MFVRVCPYFPFSARVCLNQHYDDYWHAPLRRLGCHPQVFAKDNARNSSQTGHRPNSCRRRHRRLAEHAPPIYPYEVTPRSNET